MEVVKIEVPKDKSAHVAELAKNLDVESLRILAEKSKKPGVAQKLKQFQNFI